MQALELCVLVAGALLAALGLRRPAALAAPWVAPWVVAVVAVLAAPWVAALAAP
jgi:hypothetical protein